MIFVISFLVYFGLDLTPGDAVSHMISPELAATITPEKLEAMREAYGLNASFLERYWIWLTSCLKGDFGYSMAGGVAIKDIMVKTIPATLELSIGALIMLFAIIQLFIYRFKNKMRFYAVEKSGVVLFFVMQTNQIASTFFKYNETNPRLWFVYFMTTIIIIFSVFYFLELKKYTTIYKKQLQ